MQLHTEHVSKTRFFVACFQNISAKVYYFRGSFSVDEVFNASHQAGRFASQKLCMALPGHLQGALAFKDRMALGSAML